MKYNPKIHNRKSIRLKGYDYSQEGFYFITICCQNREHFFGKITNNEMILNDAGKMIESQWLAITERFKNIKLEEYIIMPNHFHAILNIVGATFMVDPIKEKGQPQGIAPTDSPTDSPTGSETDNPTNKTIGDIIGAFKSITTNEYIKNVKFNNWKRFNGRLWQRNYWEHIIRNEKAYINISDYIKNNPYNWDKDSLK
jgi:REP element-mobilizing transposase RayT